MYVARNNVLKIYDLKNKKVANTITHDYLSKDSGDIPDPAAIET